MTEYRAYTVGIDGHFIGYEPLVSDTDNDAVSMARALVDGHDIELWTGPRFVIRLRAKKPGAVTDDSA